MLPHHIDSNDSFSLGLKNKKVLVTGSSRGIGLSIASEFLKQGADVILTGRSRESLEQVEKSLSTNFEGGRYLIKQVDFSKADSVKSFSEDVANSWGKIDILVCNIGDGRSVPDPMPGMENFKTVFDTNFVSSQYAVEFFLPLLNSSNGAILFVSSIAGLESIGAPTDYSVAKAAIIALSKNLARKLSPNVRVNCIAPGNVLFEGGSWDDKNKKDPDRIKKIIETTVPMKRFGTPQEIANVAVFICSERASFVTGACLVVDGGQTVGFH